jgi:peptidoglycan/xylan/chitin deacetylase (PgdA/CDA1 family)
MIARVSFIIPAFNAALTLRRTVDSVLSQTVGWWEIIIVNDGSTDETNVIAEGLAKSDPRIRAFSYSNAGASAARNRGLDEARSEWIVFLDSDDTVDRRFLEYLFAVLKANPFARAACCSYARLDADGTVLSKHSVARLDVDPVGLCAATPPTTIHGFIVRRDDVLAVGKFDESLVTNEDWDLWIRLARYGVKFGVIDKPLAHYWNNQSSLTKNTVQMLRDTGTVRRRCLSADPRIKTPLPEFADGIDIGDFALLQLGSALWNAGVSIASAMDARPLLDELDDLRSFSIVEVWIIETLYGGMISAADGGVSRLLDNWSIIGPLASKFLAHYEKRAGRIGLGYVFLKELERKVFWAANFLGHRTLTLTTCITVGPRLLLSGAKIPDTSDTVIFKVPWLRPRTRFMFTVPAFGVVSGSEVRRILAKSAISLLRGGLGRLRMGRWLLKRISRAAALTLRVIPIRKQPPFISAEAARLIHDGELVGELSVARRKHQPAAPMDPHEPIGSGRAEEWDRFYRVPDPWNYGSSYEQLKYKRTLELVASLSIGRALELGCSEGKFTNLLAPHVTFLRAVDVSKVAIERAQAECASRHNVEFVTSDFFDQPIEGTWDLIVCSEVLYYLDDKQQLSAMAERLFNAITLEGYIVHATGFQLVDNPKRTAFDTGVPFGAEAIGKALSQAGLELVSSLETELYRIELFRRPRPDSKQTSSLHTSHVGLGTSLDPEVLRTVVWNGAVRSRMELQKTITHEVPVLMYHRAASDGPDSLARWRIDPAALEHQLLFLRRRGFRSIEIEEWEWQRKHSGRLRGRPILLTFDDAYLDFYEVAWPIIYRNGFSAHVFVVTEKVGQRADWDASSGRPAPLMNWDQICLLAGQGATFGSHLATHIPANRLDSRSLLHEAVRSRHALQSVLGKEIRSIAAPYGISDRRITHVAEMAGYTRLFLDDYGVAPIYGDPLWTPRIEVRGGDSIETLAKWLNLSDEEQPEDKDRLPLGIFADAETGLPIPSLSAH